jgi:hypothetical protein
VKKKKVKELERAHNELLKANKELKSKGGETKTADSAETLEQIQQLQQLVESAHNQLKSAGRNRN